MEAHLQALVDYFSLHPQLALAAVFAAALLEAVAVIGTVVPGSSIVFVGGMLVGLKALDPAWTAAAAIGGAIAGDGFSFWLGRRYRERLRTMWPLKSHPALFERGHAYFARQGGRSVFFARFLGPLRAIVPVIAGMSDMPASRFYAINILSALAWAVAHLAPGFLFGASLQLAGAVSSRLVLLLLFIAAALWIVTWIAKLVQRHAGQGLDSFRNRVVAWAGNRSGPVARTALSLFDPARPESKALLLAALLLIGSAWLFFGVLQDVWSGDPLVRADRSVYAMLQALRNPWADSVMVAVTEFGGALLMFALVAAVSLLLAARRCWRTLGYWLAAAGFGAILVATLEFLLARRALAASGGGIEQLAFQGRHAATSIVIYGFLTFLLARSRPAGTKLVVTLVAATAILLIAFSRLYLGAQSLSDVLASLSLGLAWVALLSIAYLNHGQGGRVPALALAVVSGTTIVLVGSFIVAQRHESDLTRYAVRPQVHTVQLAGWEGEGWRRLPPFRSELGGDAEEPFSIQWAGSAAELGSVLGAAGWQRPPPWSVKTTLLWMLPTATIEQLPVLPKFDHGQAPQKTFVKSAGKDQRLVLRLWPSRYVVDRPVGGAQRPLWIGTATIERLRHPADMVTVVETVSDFATPPRRLAQDVIAAHRSAEVFDRGGQPVVLIW